MAKVRVSDLAKQMGVSDKDLIFKLQSLGVEVENANASLEPEVIVAILSGKKLASRPRNVIMRDDKRPDGEPVKARKIVRPPRPIITPPKREESAPAATEQPGAASPAPIIPEFLEAAEQEALEAERAAREPKPVAARTRTPKPKITEPAQPEAPAAPKPPAPASEEFPSPIVPRRPVGPTGPRATASQTARPNYQGQGQSPRAAGGGTPAGTSLRPTPRPPVGGYPPAPPRPTGPAGRSGMSGTPGRGARPMGTRPAGGRPGMGVPPPPPIAPPSPLNRRKKTAQEEERPEKKKTTGKRGKRNVATEEDTGYFTKGPFSAQTVLDDDMPDATPTKPVDGTEEEESTGTQRAPAASTRRDARKQAAPVSGRVLEFKKPTGRVTLTEGVTVKELADRLEIKANDLVKHLMMKKGLMVNINQPLGSDLAVEIARELGLEAEVVSFEEAVELEAMEKMESASGGTESRAPVITVMGHVDHGKTSLLDAIRETDVAAGEAGGITQHIGAYAVEKRGRKIVFLDTPGHEAFTMMRARGAKVTDIVILVVAADDGVMPQTREAIDHARAAKVPMIVAINKIDKPNANVERVRRELADQNVLVEQWGGEVVSVEVSAKEKKGIDEILEMILLASDMLELKASSDVPARGVVLEARKEAGRGIVANVLIQDGTLKIGDVFFAGAAAGRVRAMIDDRGHRLTAAPPATPVAVMGFDDIPKAGDSFVVVDEQSHARMIGEMRQEKARDQAIRKNDKMSLDQLFMKMQQGTVKDLNLIVKADVQGSVEVLNDTLRKLSNEQVRVNILHASVGAISTNDVLLATASDAIVVGFSVRPERNAQELAEKEGVEIRLHTIIYELMDEIRLAMTGLLEPKFQEVIQGRAEVRNTFKVPKMGTIAGCYVTEGVIPRSAGVRLLRDNRVIYEGKIGSLRHFKNDVSEMRSGFECGIGLERFQDVKIGDVIEAFKIEKQAGVLQ
ncbi:MAG TPA: translation initiation factor IF-2 [Thermoanaerobaculia bacterium]|nr:translation initiation factor IF-2 [Thermoanaerobaculia bacterium]